MLNKDIIKRKINSIEEYTRDLEPILRHTTDEIVDDALLLRAAERNFQLIVDTMLDINTHIIASEGLTSTLSLQDTFHVLAGAGILPKEFVKNLSPVVGLRNKIVHEYEGVSTHMFVEDIKSGISQFGEFLVFIDTYLQSR